MKGGRQQTTYLSMWAGKIYWGQKTDATSTPTSQEKDGGQEETACGLHSQDGLQGNDQRTV